MSKLYYILSIFLITISCFPQTPLKGKILDESGKPVSFANIYITESKKSTISNEDGNFYLFINPDVDNTLIISHLSYQDTSIKIDKNFPGIIVLREDTMLMDEIIIGKEITGYDIARNVVQNLDKNHNIEPAYFEYFRRVATYSNNFEKIDLIEEYFGKLKHTTGNQTKANIKKSRSVTYNQRGEQLQRQLMMHHFLKIRNDHFLLYKPVFLKKGHLKNYNITIEGSKKVNGTDCYILKYTNGNEDYSNKKAKLYIDKKTYGIVYIISGSYDKNSIDYVERNFTQIDGKWILTSVTEKHRENISSTTYTFLKNKDSYKEEKFESVAKNLTTRLKNFNKNPNDTFLG